jgi:hypothetical protein
MKLPRFSLGTIGFLIFVLAVDFAVLRQELADQPGAWALESLHNTRPGW